MGSTMRKARVKYHGSTDTYSYEGLPSEPPQRRPRKRAKHPNHDPDQCCIVCHAENKRTGWQERRYAEDPVQPTAELMRRASSKSDPTRGSHVHHGQLKRRMRPSKGAMLYQLIANSTGGQGGEGL